MTTKSIVLQELSKAENSSKYISGEDLSNLCHVSRAAIWKAIKSLEKDGCQIEAVTNRGYKLIDSSDIFDKEGILEFLPNDIDAKIEVYKTIDSTQTEAKRRCVEAKSESLQRIERLNRTVILSAQQTAGHGRMGRSFYSPDKTGVYLSIILSPKNGITDPALITASTGVAVCRAIEKLYGSKAQIKWVNDIFISGKKVCGIITEGISDFESGIITTAIIGIGINICNSDFPQELLTTVGSITNDRKSRISRNQLAAAVIAESLGVYESFDDVSEKSKIMKEYKERSILIGKEITITPVIGQTETYKATVLDIDEEAHLVVKTSDGETKILRSGEVSLGSSQFTNKE
jgi:BirA family biotin operon repressor/biotin-[acetyl-CoA-carboxylase] ligase